MSNRKELQDTFTDQLNRLSESISYIKDEIEEGNLNNSLLNHWLDILQDNVELTKYAVEEDWYTEDEGF